MTTRCHSVGYASRRPKVSGRKGWSPSRKTNKQHVDESLNATLTGACDLNYRGNPKVTKTIIGAGDVTRTDAKAGA